MPAAASPAVPATAWATARDILLTAFCLLCSLHLLTVPATARSESGPVPLLYYLSGLTCNDENFIQKAGVCMIQPATACVLGVMVPGA